jgi:hypothetical protein
MTDIVVLRKRHLTKYPPKNELKTYPHFKKEKACPHPAVASAEWDSHTPRLSPQRPCMTSTSTAGPSRIWAPPAIAAPPPLPQPPPAPPLAPITTYLLLCTRSSAGGPPELLHIPSDSHLLLRVRVVPWLAAGAPTHAARWSSLVWGCTAPLPPASFPTAPT